MTTRSIVFVVSIVTVVALVAGCGTTSSNTARGYAGPPVVDQAGQYLKHYLGPQIEALVDYTFAANHLGEDWLALGVSFTGTQAESVEIHRDGVSLRTPDGTRVFLPSQQEFIEDFNQVQSLTRRAELATQPLDFTGADRRRGALSFLPLPGTAVARESVFVNYRNLYSGMLYFPIPGGVQAGTWKLIVDLEEERVEIPFTLGS